jgi:hypothetical protein
VITHRPYGSGHPYRFDLDQRVPVRPQRGEEYEIRVLADPTVPGVEAVFAGGERIALVRTDPQRLTTDHGPPPAPATPTTDGHLSAAAEPPDTGGRAVWVGRVAADQDTSYVVEGGGARLGPYELVPLAWQPDGGTLTGAEIAPERVEWLVGSEGPRRVRFTLPLREGDHVVGFGERFHRPRPARGAPRRAGLRAVQAAGPPHLPADAVRGRVRSVRQLGLPPGDVAADVFDVGATDSDRLVVEAEISPDDPTLTVRGFAGSPSDVIRQFVARTGGAAVPPEWVFRVWMSGNEWNTQERVLREVERSLAEKIPVGAVVIEAWSDEATFTMFRDAKYPLHADGSPHRLADFEFPPDGAWPDPRAMVDRLHEAGVKVLLWQIPLIPTDRGAGEQVEADARALVDNGLAIGRPTARPTATGAGGSRVRCCPTSRTRTRWRGGWPSGAIWSTSSAWTDSRPTAVSTPGATTSATPTGRPANRPTIDSPCSTPRPTTS